MDKLQGYMGQASNAISTAAHSFSSALEDYFPSKDSRRLADQVRLMLEDQDAQPTNLQLVAADHDQAYEENNVQGMTTEQLARASFGESLEQFKPGDASGKIFKNAIAEAKKLNTKAGGSKNQEETIVVTVVAIIVRFEEGSNETLEVAVSAALVEMHKGSQS